MVHVSGHAPRNTLDPSGLAVWDDALPLRSCFEQCFSIQEKVAASGLDRGFVGPRPPDFFLIS